MRALFSVSLLLSLLICFLSCSKGTDAPVDPGPDTRVDSTVTPVVADGKWEITIDGKSYSGSVDTSFAQNVFNTNVDTLIVAAGTSADKKAHILFNIAMNRKAFPVNGVNLLLNSHLIFDTSNFNRGTSFINGSPSINYQLDTFNATRVVVRYSGTMTNRTGLHSFSGKLSFELNKGTKEPNTFACQLELSKQSGYFMNACFSANTLVLNGTYYRDLAHKSFRLLVKTGGTITPGTYKSSDGDVAIYVVEPGYTGNSYYIDDTSGTATVVIESVSGNIVKGSFSGTNWNANRIHSGNFICRVGNYVPQTIAATRWSFGAWVGSPFGFYEAYAGNVVSAVKTSSNGRNYLTINGESDHGKSVFKIVVSSTSPITKGSYILNGFPNNVLDTLYFKSGVTTWDGTVPRLWADLGASPSGIGTGVFIDSMNNSGLSGRFYNRLANNLDDVNFQGSGERRIDKAKFNAGF